MASAIEKPDMTRQSDVDLVRLAKGGLREAFAELVRRHGSVLRTHLRRMGAQGADADDMAQEALLVAYEHLAEYRFDGPFTAWLKKIAARRYLKKVRKDTRYVLSEDMSAYEAGSAPNDAGLDGDFRARTISMRRWGG
jgi:DNA-directed RNA polymerase specialized sigma24 family protein